MMRVLAIVLATLCGYCFLTFLLFVGSLVQAHRIIWACLPAWPFLAAALIVLMMIFGFWSGLGLWFGGFWVFGFFSSDQWFMVKNIFARKIAV